MAHDGWRPSRRSISATMRWLRSTNSASLSPSISILNRGRRQGNSVGKRFAAGTIPAAAQRLSPRAWPHRGTATRDVPPSRNALAAFGAPANSRRQPEGARVPAASRHATRASDGGAQWQTRHVTRKRPFAAVAELSTGQPDGCGPWRQGRGSGVRTTGSPAPRCVTIQGRLSRDPGPQTGPGTAARAPGLTILVARHFHRKILPAASAASAAITFPVTIENPHFEE